MKKILMGLFISIFYACGTTSGLNDLIVVNNQKIGIATSNPDELLTVNGVVHAREVRIDLKGALAPDYVFRHYYDQPTQNGYELMQLDTLAAFIKKHHHLPNIRNQAELAKNGLNMKTFSLNLLEKIEELTIYIIQQQNQIESLMSRLEKSGH